MGNLTTSLRKFLQNKNTVTVVGAILAIIVLYVAYTIRVRSSINPVSVPYATEKIYSGTQIANDQVGTVQVPPSMLNDNVIRNASDIIDKYAAADTVIPEGSLFYKSAVVEKEQLPDNIILEYPKGYVLYNLSTDINSTYGNSVYPGNYIDIYFKAVNRIDENSTSQLDGKADQIIYGKFISNIKVLAVRDSSGKPVFQNLDENRTPSMIIFAVPEEYYILLKKAEYMRSFDTSLVLVPTNNSLKDEPSDIEMSSDELKNWINDNTVYTGN